MLIRRLVPHSNGGSRAAITQMFGIKVRMHGGDQARIIPLSDFSASPLLRVQLPSPRYTHVCRHVCGHVCTPECDMFVDMRLDMCMGMVVNMCAKCVRMHVNMCAKKTHA